MLIMQQLEKIIGLLKEGVKGIHSSLPTSKKWDDDERNLRKKLAHLIANVEKCAQTKPEKLSAETIEKITINKLKSLTDELKELVRFWRKMLNEWDLSPRYKETIGQIDTYKTENTHFNHFALILHIVAIKIQNNDLNDLKGFILQFVDIKFLTQLLTPKSLNSKPLAPAKADDKAEAAAAVKHSTPAVPPVSSEQFRAGLGALVELAKFESLTKLLSPKSHDSKLHVQNNTDDKSQTPAVVKDAMLPICLIGIKHIKAIIEPLERGIKKLDTIFPTSEIWKQHVKELERKLAALIVNLPKDDQKHTMQGFLKQSSNNIGKLIVELGSVITYWQTMVNGWKLEHDYNNIDMRQAVTFFDGLREVYIKQLEFDNLRVKQQINSFDQNAMNSAKLLSQRNELRGRHDEVFKQRNEYNAQNLRLKGFASVLHIVARKVQSGDLRALDKIISPYTNMAFLTSKDSKDPKLQASGSAPPAVQSAPAAPPAP
jgi:sulfur relay (sulfurtransferase) DsrC/TusE family protein